ncbi:MAG: FtsW/RodA/SpoVE family cell cycle protein [Oscillatoriales cyanobacterium SM2_2_1]|nr:FtsW/RodA/SpoVE family cell cycle protein [Oscillatoriales cyanobacterium SM2_2_1]
MKLLQVLPFFDQTVDRWVPAARILRWLIFLWVFAGLFILFSASHHPAATDALIPDYYFFKQQVLWAGVGLILFNALVHLPAKVMVRSAPIGIFILLGLLLAIEFIPGLGATRNESRRWLTLWGVLVQPSELIKPFLVLQGAQFFTQWSVLGWGRRSLWLGTFTVVILAIYLQPSLSVAALCGMMLWLLALAAGRTWGQLLTVAAMAMIGAMVTIRPYQIERLMMFTNPWRDPQGSGYQLIQSLLAIASGGAWGTGYGLSGQKLFLPEGHTDFIFAIFAEEFGFGGCALVLAFLMVFSTFCLWQSSQCRDMTLRLTIVGTTVILVGQSLLNIGVVTGGVPTTGIPFPFLSYGGSSMLSNMFIAGLLVRCIREMGNAEVVPLRPATPAREPMEQRSRRRFSSRNQFP